MSRDFVCLCLDITRDDIQRAIAEGYDEPETLKRYTGCFMGPCQGKSCMDRVLDVLEECGGRQGRRPTLRPPAVPAHFGALAGLSVQDPAAE